MNWLLAPFPCFLAAWVINCCYSCLRFILGETEVSFSRGVQLIPPVCLIQGRDFTGQTETLAMLCTLWGEFELVGNPVILPARAFIRAKGTSTDVGVEEVT